jgi:hypothetical protein
MVGLPPRSLSLKVGSIKRVFSEIDDNSPIDLWGNSFWHKIPGSKLFVFDALDPDMFNHEHRPLMTTEGSFKVPSYLLN